MRLDYSKQLGQRIVIHGKQKSQYLNISDITHISSINTHVTIYGKEIKISSCRQLKDFEEELVELGFARINRSTIINLAYIKTYNGGDKKSVELVNGNDFTVSRRKAHLFKQVELA